MSDLNAVFALKNAWNGVISSSAEVEKLAPAVAALDGNTPVDGLDLATYQRAALAQSIAVMALRGLIEELQRKRDEGKQA
jgi:hypothetical protein